MRLFRAVVMIAGTVWLVVGCGGAVAPLVGGAVKGETASGLVLVDSVTQTRYSLSVMDGAASLKATSGAEMVVSEPELVDGATGAKYSLGVARGALSLAPDASGGPGATQIGLADTVTAKTYELAVVRGALTLNANLGSTR